MSILPSSLLSPSVYQIQNPLASILNCLDVWIETNQPDFKNTWLNIKVSYVKRLTGLTKNGATMRGMARKASSTNAELSDTLLDVYNLLDRSIYFTSHLWRAFFYYLKTDKFNPNWPQFGYDEARVISSLLTESDMEKLRAEAEHEWCEVNSKLIEDVLKKIQRPIYRLCYKRAGFLQNYDPAIYSLDDIQQHVIESVLISLRNNDHLPRSCEWLVRWSVKCADNILINMLVTAKAKKRNKILDDRKDGKHRECSLDAPIVLDKNGHTDDSEMLTLADSIDVIGYHQAYRSMREMENQRLLDELLRLADPKINCYLRTICGGEHNEDFWQWFYYNEPQLAQRISYIEEHPEAIGPYLQRHLNLPTHQLTRFLKQHLPEILDRVSSTPQNKRRLAV